VHEDGLCDNGGKINSWWVRMVVGMINKGGKTGGSEDKGMTSNVADACNNN
jgi:hypothetical protein